MSEQQAIPQTRHPEAKPAHDFSEQIIELARNLVLEKKSSLGAAMAAISFALCKMGATIGVPREHFKDRIMTDIDSVYDMHEHFNSVVAQGSREKTQ